VNKIPAMQADRYWDQGANHRPKNYLTVTQTDRQTDRHTHTHILALMLAGFF